MQSLPETQDASLSTADTVLRVNCFERRCRKACSRPSSGGGTLPSRSLSPNRGRGFKEDNRSSHKGVISRSRRHAWGGGRGVSAECRGAVLRHDRPPTVG